MSEKLGKRERLKLPRINPPIRDPEERIADFREVYLEYDAEAAIQEASRCVECKNPPCERACPLHNHIRDWLILTAQGKFLEAAALSQSLSNMPEVCGRICPQDRLCEEACIVGAKNQPVAIGAIERFINEYAFRELGGIPMPQVAPSTGKQVAIVGAGPAGLACAEELRKMGHSVTVFEALPTPGGLLVYGIPGFKLEKRVVERRIEYLKKLGIEFICHVKVGQDLSLQDLFDQGFHAIFLGTGAQRPKNPKLPGMEFKGVHEALPFLIRNNLDEEELPPGMGRDDLRGRKVAVFGGGDTAMDCLRTSVRLQASKVVCVYRRDEENMPGSRQEVKRAKEEGVEFHFLTTPVRFSGDEEGHVRKVECLKMRLGEPDQSGRQSPIPIEGSHFEFEADFIILAFGFEGDPVPNEDGKLKLTKWGTYEVDEGKMTSWRGVFAGGDGVRGADLLVTALKDGRDAAVGIDRYLRSV
ncbi:MAG: NAD(P)-dependent oxidoreductase [candidate division NC10 bacterium]|nr:NAD(P)-dependent oxidoreductase [candidate division NC10 bacterium]